MFCFYFFQGVIEHKFTEVCIKDARKAIVRNLSIDGRVVRKDRSMSFDNAHYLVQSNPNRHHHGFDGHVLPRFVIYQETVTLNPWNTQPGFYQVNQGYPGSYLLLPSQGTVFFL